MPAHPRSRGENAGDGCPVCHEGGSSPLTRGKRLRVGGLRVGCGLIPAHAGKTQPHERGRAESWAHPRSRGENLSDLFIDAAAQGSSPLTRGKPNASTANPPPTGLIPAHAGKTITKRNRPRPWPAHPRSRGENYATRRNPDNPTGSSPLTRGKPRNGSLSTSTPRLIPAHAGKT